MPRDLGELSTRMARLLTEGGQIHRHAQAHARAILTQLDTPPEAWPNFSEGLDERLLYSSNLMIVHGLELVEHEEHIELGRQLLTRGGESLEFLADVRQARFSIADELIKAAIAYHIAGHHARAYVITQRLLRRYADRDSFTLVLVALLTRDLSLLSSRTFAMLRAGDSQDTPVAGGLRDGSVDDDDAIAALGRRSLSQAIALFIEYLKRGLPDLLGRARTRCRDVALLGMEARHVDLWLLGMAVEQLLRNLGDSSMWHNLRDLGPTFPFGSPIRRYIEGNLSRSPACISLWPSQLHALPLVKAADAPSFCIRMPTSAGKTKIAELTILRALLDTLGVINSKCLYIAPFRSLAVEVEHTLSNGLRSLGIRVSEIYGGFDLTAADERLIQETQVLVATPEKFDAVIRLAPELLEEVRLVIVDEGHIAGEISERGMRAEFLINRLLWKLGRTDCRHVFISAVLPNPAEFARWIAGDETNVATSQWRPSRLMFGDCAWNGTRVRVGFTHEGTSRLDQEVFVNEFVSSQEVRGLAGVGGRRNPFPHNANEAFAATVIKFATYGTTLAFVPQARYVESTAKIILKALGIMRSLKEHEGHTLRFPLPDVASPLVQECLEIIADELGNDSEVATLLTSGIAVHHSSLPARTKVAMERLLRSGQVRLVVATTTLGQGVNLPIRTIVVKGLQQGENATVSPMAFWNIAGRAGRAMHENEGQVLFFNDATRDPRVVANQRRTVAGFIDQSAITDVIGLLHRALSFLRQRWRQLVPQIDFDALCLKLAQDDFEWVDDNSRPTMKAVFAMIDQHLLALSTEGDFGPDEPDKLQEILRESLLFAQLESRVIPDIDRQAAHGILLSRLRSLFRRVPSPVRRNQFYRMGLSIADCEKVTAARDEILAAVLRANEWANATIEERLNIVITLVQLAMRLDAASAAIKAKVIPANATDIVRAWLSGDRAVDMVTGGLAAGFDNDAGALGRFLEEFCVYGLAWVMTGFVGFVRRELEELGQNIPEAATHFPAMIKMGVPEPLAAVFAPYLQNDRKLAIIAASACPYGIDEITRTIAWVNAVEPETLIELGVDGDAANGIAAKRRTLAELGTGTDDPQIVWALTIAKAKATKCVPGEPLLVLPRQERSRSHFEVLAIDGESLGTFRLNEGELPAWLSESHRVEATTQDVSEHDADRMQVRIMVRLLAA